MSRPRGLTLVIVLLLSCASRGNAQAVASRNGSGTNPYRGSTRRLEPYGGFGLETMRTPISGRLWQDRFGLGHATAPAEPPAAITRGRRAAKPVISQTSRRASKTANSLPTGSLSWPGSNDVILYSPGLRHQGYGGGYGLGPYGSIDCGIMYKGMWLGY